MMGRTEVAAAPWLNPSAVLLRFGSMAPITRRQVFRKGLSIYRGQALPISEPYRTFRRFSDTTNSTDR
jgi:hypothetical protein